MHRYRRGDIVRLKKYARTPSRWTSYMMKYCDRVVEIRTIHDRQEEQFTINQEVGDPQTYIFWFNDIEELVEAAPTTQRDTAGMVLSLEQVLPIAIEIFGIERVFTGTDTNSVTIHFPEVNITNSREDKHKIRDLFVKFKFTWMDTEDTGDEILLRIVMTGTRSTFTCKEFYSHYCHSHLPSDPFHWGNFCTGSSAFQMVKTNLSLSSSIDDFYMLFYSLEKYVSWESLEGGPHAKIANISCGEGISDEALKAELKKIAEGIPTGSINYSNGIYVMMTDEIYDYFDKHSSIRRNNTIRSTGLEENIERYQRDIQIHRGTHLEFNNGRFEYKIIKDEEEDNGERIEKSIVQRYIDIINENGKAFNKKLAYERAKRNQSTFGKIGVI